jgi:hypothetical protein
MRAALLALFVALVGFRPLWADTTSIATIVGAGESYDGREVTVVGEVKGPVATHAGEAVYVLAGDDRRITVFGRGDAPVPGTRLQVTAQVRWREGDEEFTWPPVLIERTRQAAP